MDPGFLCKNAKIVAKVISLRLFAYVRTQLLTLIHYVYVFCTALKSSVQLLLLFRPTILASFTK